MIFIRFSLTAAIFKVRYATTETFPLLSCMLYPSNQNRGTTVHLKKRKKAPQYTHRLYVAYRNSMSHNTTQRHGNDTPEKKSRKSRRLVGSLWGRSVLQTELRMPLRTLTSFNFDSLCRRNKIVTKFLSFSQRYYLEINVKCEAN